MEWLAFVLFGVVCLLLLVGYPVAPTLAGTSLLFAGVAGRLGYFDAVYLEAFPNRLFGVMMNDTLVAVPLFIFMGVMLERSRMAEHLLDTMALLFGPLRGGLGISVVVVGILLAASTGIVGATVVTMGLLSLPTLLRRGYDPALTCGILCASGTLGQLIPPSIILVLLGDVLSGAYQQAQLNRGIFAPDTVSVGDLFAGALLPGLLLGGLYIVYLVGMAIARPHTCPAIPLAERQTIPRTELARRTLTALLPPCGLIIAVLGSILGGLATPTEAASVGAMGTLLLAAIARRLTLTTLQAVMRQTTQITAMVFFIFIGASLFSLVFRGLGGDDAVHRALTHLPGGAVGAFWIVMLIMFLLGFVLDFVEIILIIVPIVGPILLAMDIHPVWLGVMMAINLQTSFLTPPFGFALFYLRGVAPPGVRTTDLYRGVMPFIVLQLIALGIVACVPGLATWLPTLIYGK